jgi:hypothetical protein
MAPGMSNGLLGGSEVVECSLCSGDLGRMCDLGTTNRHASLYNALEMKNIRNINEVLANQRTYSIESMYA